MKQPKFKVGDKVYYVNGRYGEHECKVESVSTEAIPGAKYSEPIYTISWRPTGFSAAHESDLTAAPRQSAAANTAGS
jgi:hypothetical protein